MQSRLLTVVAALGAALAVSHSGGALAQGGSIFIGSSIPLTGTAASFGQIGRAHV